MQKVSSMVSSKIGDTLENIKNWSSVFYNVAEYGIYPDGTDVTNKLQALVNLANSEGRSSIFFPTGDYLVTALNNDSTVIYVGDNAQFIGGYTRQIAQIGVGDNKNNSLWFDVKTFGAVGDGVTNDTAAIQSAINAAGYGSVIWIPKGSYKVDQLLISGKTGIRITGSGELKSRANLAVVSYQAILDIESSKDIVVEYLNISGVNSGANDRGIWVSNSTNVTIKNNRFTNFAQEAIYLWGANDALEPANSVYDNYIFGNNYGIKLAINAEYYMIHRNKFISNSWGIIGGMNNTRIDNNTFMLNDYGIWLDSTLGSNPDHTSISGNVINHNKNVGLLMSNLVNGMQVVDNQMLSTVGGVWPTTGKPHSLVMINVKDVTMIGNRIDASSGSTIYVSGHVGCRYIGNTFHGGEFKEESIGGKNVYTGNNFLAPSKLTLFAGTPAPIRAGDIEQGVFKTDLSGSIVKTVATLQNGWVTPASYSPLSFWKDSNGSIHLQGVIENGTVGSMITTLPVGYRPSAIIDINGTATNSGTFAAFRIYTNGNVQHLSGGNVLVGTAASFST